MVFGHTVGPEKVWTAQNCTKGASADTEICTTRGRVMDEAESEPGDRPPELQHTPLQHTADGPPPPTHTPAPQPTRPADQHHPWISRTVRLSDSRSTQWPVNPLSNFKHRLPGSSQATPHSARALTTPREMIRHRTTIQMPQAPYPMPPLVATNLLASQSGLKWNGMHAESTPISPSRSSTGSSETGMPADDDASTMSCSTACSHCTTPGMSFCTPPPPRPPRGTGGEGGPLSALTVN